MLKNPKKEMLILAIYLAVVAVFYVIPPIAPITVAGMHLVGVFFAAIIGWSFSEHYWPSILTMILFPFTGMTNLAGMIQMGIGNDTCFFLILIFILVSFLTETGADTYVAAFLMTRKFLKGHPWRLIFMLFVVAWVLSTFCGNFPGMIITWAIIYKICAALGYKPFDKFSNILVFGVAVMGAISLSAVPWANNALVILGSYMASTGDTVNYLHYLAYSVPFGLISIAGYLLLAKFLFRLDVSKLKDFDPNIFSKEELELTFERKVALGALAALILLILVPSVMPKTSFIGQLSAATGLTIKTLLIFLVLSFITKDGKAIFELPKLASKGVPWNMVLMVFGIMGFVSLLGSADAGISAFLAKTFTPMFANASVLTLFILVLLITILLTNFMINMVVAVIMISATMPIAAQLGADPLQLVYLITVSATIAFMLPAASAASCCLFANTEWVRGKDVYPLAFPTIIMMALVALGWNFILFLF